MHVLAVLPLLFILVSGVNPGDQFLWSGLTPQYCYGTLQVQVVKPFFTPLGTARVIEQSYDSVGQFWTAKYVSQEQYVQPTNSFVFIPSSNVCFYRPGWGFAQQVKSWSSSTYSPIGLEKSLGAVFCTFDGTDSDVGSCGLYLSSKVMVSFVANKQLLAGYGFSQTVVIGTPGNSTRKGEAQGRSPLTFYQATLQKSFRELLEGLKLPKAESCILVKGIVDNTGMGPQANCTTTIPSGFNDLPAACQVDPSTLPDYCSNLEPLNPDCRATLEFA